MSESSYNEIFFESKPSPERHVGRLSSVARLFGLESRGPQKCSVLEIGCSTGINLLPQAISFPESTFTGIDLAEKQIAFGQDLVKRLALKNATLVQANLMQYEMKPAAFDYIFVHGLYTWVEQPLREKILELCAKGLSEKGVAYVSINVSPGWLPRGALHQVLLQSDQVSAPALERVKHARSIMKAMIAELIDDFSPGGQQLKWQLEYCGSQSDSFILHELLVKETDSLYLSEFLKQAEQFGLQYLGDGQPVRMRGLSGETLGAELMKLQQAASPRWQNDQMHDLLSSVSFRGVLLCKQGVQLEAPDPQRLDPLYLTSCLVPLDPERELSTPGAETFCSPNDLHIEISDPALRAVLRKLSERWPETIAWSEIGDSPEVLPELTKLFFRNLVDFHVVPLACRKQESPQPYVNRFIRAQASFMKWVTSERHEVVLIGDFEKHLLPMLDGASSTVDLANAMVTVFHEQGLGVREGGSPVTDQARLKQLLKEQIEAYVQQFSEAGLLSHQP